MMRHWPRSPLARLSALGGLIVAAVLVVAPHAPVLAADVPQFLMLPFDASDKKIVIQRAWTTRDPNTGAFTLLHHAIDYVNGTRDVPDSWKGFDVLAAAEGEACGARTGQGGCFDSGEIMGNRVLIKHKVEGQTFYTFYNHLATIADDIPLNDVHDTVHVDAGEAIGVAGASNSVGFLHLHMELLDEKFKPIDPYGIYGITDQYPDPRGKNGKSAGKKNYFLTDPPQPFGAKVKPTEAAASSAEPTIDAIVSPSAAPQSQGAPAASATSAATVAPTPTPPPAVSTLSASQTPSSSNSGGGGGMDLVPIVVGLGAVVLAGVGIGLYGLTRRTRNPLPRDRWRP